MEFFITAVGVIHIAATIAYCGLVAPLAIGAARSESMRERAFFWCQLLIVTPAVFAIAANFLAAVRDPFITLGRYVPFFYRWGHVDSPDIVKVYAIPACIACFASPFLQSRFSPGSRRLMDYRRIAVSFDLMFGLTACFLIYMTLALYRLI